MKNLLRRAGALMAALTICLALSVPALADETYVTGTIPAPRVASLTNSSSLGWTTADIYGDSYDNPVSNQSFTSAVYGYKTGAAGLAYWNLSGIVSVTGIYGVYLSFYFDSTLGFSANKVPESSDFVFRVTDSSTGVTSSLPVSSLSLYAPSSTSNSVSDGISIVGRISNTVANPISSCVFRSSVLSIGGSTAPAWYVQGTQFSASNGSFASLRVNSMRVVSSGSNAELDALESMASEIANQSQILSQFYGDIVAVCNQIYQRLGDLQAAQEEANALFANVITLLNNTNSKLSSINQAMSTYFELVLKALSDESLDIQQAIADAELRLETYLKPMIDYFTELEEQTGESASTLPQHKTEIDSFENTGYGIDQDGQTGLAAVLPLLGAFDFIFSIFGLLIGLGIIKLIIQRGLS